MQDTYYVLFLASETSLPIRLATHVWIVTVYNGKIHRWDILHKPQPAEHRVGHLHKNFQAPFQGLPKYYFGNAEHWDSVLSGFVSGKKGSVAHSVYTFVEKQIVAYQHATSYVMLPGPNSNSFVQWVIDSFSLPITLPSTALGKNYFRYCTFIDTLKERFTLLQKKKVV